MAEAIVEQKGRSVAGTAMPIAPTLPLEPASDRGLKAGERELLRGPLSRKVSYRLMLQGELGRRELGKLITLLNAQKAVLADDPDQEHSSA